MTKYLFFYLICSFVLFSCKQKDYKILKTECYNDRFVVCNELLEDKDAGKELNDYGFEQLMIGCKAKYLDACQFLIKYYEAHNKNGLHDEDLLKTHRQSCKVGHKASCDYFEEKTGKRTLNIR